MEYNFDPLKIALIKAETLVDEGDYTRAYLILKKEIKTVLGITQDEINNQIIASENEK